MMSLFGKRLAPLLIATAALTLSACGDRLVRHNASSGGAPTASDDSESRGFAGDSFDLSSFTSGDSGLGFDALLGALAFNGSAGSSLSGTSNSPPFDFTQQDLVGLMVDSFLAYNKELPANGGADTGYAANFSNAGNVGYWCLNEGLGGPYRDSSPSGRHGTGSPASTPGMFRGAARFNNDSVITIPNLATDPLNFNTKTELSWAAWLTTNTPATGAFVMGRSNQYRISYATTATTSDIRCQFFGGGAYRTIVAGIPKASGAVWFHVACVKSATTLSLYLNGLKVAEGAFAQAVANSGAADLNFYIGGLGGANRWKGDIDEVGVWNRALSAQEIDLMHQRGNAVGIQYRAGDTVPLTGPLLGPGGPNTYFLPVASDSNTNPLFISLPRQKGKHVEIAIRFGLRSPSQRVIIRRVLPIKQ